MKTYIDVGTLLYACTHTLACKGGLGNETGGSLGMRLEGVWE